MSTHTSTRYEVRAIADETCTTLDPDELILTTDDLTEALDAASQTRAPYGAGVLDTQTGATDLGRGFGAPVEG